MHVPKASLPDCTPDTDQSDLESTYDSYFYAASVSVGVPYALMKAHAFRESRVPGTKILNPGANHYDNPSRGASYGVMQVEYLKGSDMYAKYGYPDSELSDGSPLYDLSVNTIIASHIIKDNLNRFSSLRDAINAYNTGVGETVRKAPNNYVNDVLKNYSDIVGQVVS